MKSILLGCGAIVGVAVLGVIIVSLYVIGVNNTEVGLRTSIEAKQKDNTSEYDNMWKKISQVAQVTNAQRETLKEIFVDHAKARAGSGDGNAVMKWIKESVPNIDTSTFNQLQNIIVGSRDRWTMRQKELIDLSREHNALLQRFPSGQILAVFGRKPIDIVIVTSSRTTTAFTTGTDDDVSVFGAKQESTSSTR